MRPGNTLVVWKLDRLARSLKQLVETVEDPGEREIGMKSLTEAIDATTNDRRPMHLVLRGMVMVTTKKMTINMF